jgi:hypothetical protein
MGLLKYIAIGAAVAYGVNYITKKRVEDGRSLYDDLTDQAPEFVDKIKQYGEQALDQVKQRTQSATENL